MTGKVLPPSFLEDSGILFEINRTVLHPYGYWLRLENNQLVLEDHTHETGGLVFTAEEMSEGLERIARFFQDRKVIHRIGERVKLLGTVVQGASVGRQAGAGSKDDRGVR